VWGARRNNCGMSGHRHTEGQRQVEPDVLFCCLCEISDKVGMCCCHWSVAEEKRSGIRRLSLREWLATVKRNEVPSPSEFSSSNMVALTSFETSVITLLQTRSRPTRLESSTAKIIFFLNRRFLLVGVFSWGKNALSFSLQMCFLRRQLRSLLQSSGYMLSQQRTVSRTEVTLQGTAQILTSLVNIAALRRKKETKPTPSNVTSPTKLKSQRKTRNSQNDEQQKGTSIQSTLLSVCLSVCLSVRLSVCL